jgi:hypothetical protein
MTQDSARKEVDRERNCTPLNFFSENHKASNHEKTKLLILDTKKPVGVQLGYKKYVPQWGYFPQKTTEQSRNDAAQRHWKVFDGTSFCGWFLHADLVSNACCDI